MIVVAGSAYSYASCNVPVEKMRETLRMYEVTDVRRTGRAFFACGQEWYGSYFVAERATGDEAEGAVCCDVTMKRCYVRGIEAR